MVGPVTHLVHRLVPEQSYASHYHAVFSSVWSGLAVLASLSKVTCQPDVKLLQAPEGLYSLVDVLSLPGRSLESESAVLCELRSMLLLLQTANTVLVLQQQVSR